MNQEGVIQAIQAVEDEQIVSDCDGLSIVFSFATSEDGEPEVDIVVNRRVSDGRNGYKDESVYDDIALESFACAIVKAAELLRKAARTAETE